MVSFLARIHAVQTSLLLSESALLVIYVAATTISAATAATATASTYSSSIDIVGISFLVVTSFSQI
jgi:hypothetical protein